MKVRYVGRNSAVVGIDLYELVYKGGSNELSEVRLTSNLLWSLRQGGDGANSKTPRCCPRRGAPSDRHNWNSYTSKFIECHGTPIGVRDESDFIIREGFLAHGDMVIVKERAGDFFGTPMLSRLRLMGVENLIIVGETTSGCVRASTIDVYSNGFHSVVVADCCFDQSAVSHTVSLSDLHHKYSAVMTLEETLNGISDLS